MFRKVKIRFFNGAIYTLEDMYYILKIQKNLISFNFLKF